MLRTLSAGLVRSIRCASVAPAPRFSRNMAAAAAAKNDDAEEIDPAVLAEKEKQHHQWIGQSIQLLKHAAAVSKLPPGATAPAPPKIDDPVKAEV